MELSILIPSRSEMFLKDTVDDILKNSRAETEIIVALDGDKSEPELEQNDRVSVITLNKSIGQRAATNLAARLSRAKYLMKLDAHCSFDEGFDQKMLDAYAKTGDNVTMVPIMRNLWAFDWKCYKCGARIYQDREPKCPDCGAEMRRKMLWIGKHNPQSTSYCFDSEPKFRYFENWKHREPYMTDKKEKGLTETMSLQGSCFMCTRENYWKLKLCDEEFGSWGNQGIEVACKTWLTGGKVLCNHATWYSHLFRTKTVFGFPWPVSGREQQRTKKRVRDFIWNGGFPGQIHPVRWLVEKFAPVPGWTQEEIDKLG